MLGGLSLITELISHINLIVEMTSTTLNDFEFIHSPNNTYVHMLVLILISLSIIWPLIIDIYASYVYIWTITLKQFLCEIIKISHKNEHYFLGLEINLIENMNQNPTHHQITVERLFFYYIYYLNLVVSILMMMLIFFISCPAEWRKHPNTRKGKWKFFRRENMYINL